MPLQTTENYFTERQENLLCGGKMINITKVKRQREALRPLSGFLPLLAVTLQYTSFSLNTPFNVIFKSCCHRLPRLLKYIPQPG